MFVGIVRRDFEAVVAALVRLRFVRPGSDFGQVRRTVAWAVDSFYEMSFAELRLVEPREILDQTYDLLRAEAFQIQTSFAFLGRAIGTLGGLCTGLDPGFEFNKVAGPYARRLMTEGSSISTSIRRVRSEVRDFLVTTSSLPRLTQEVLEGSATQTGFVAISTMSPKP